VQQLVARLRRKTFVTSNLLTNRNADGLYLRLVDGATGARGLADVQDWATILESSEANREGTALMVLDV
jgi:hypothetical protein